MCTNIEVVRSIVAPSFEDIATAYIRSSEIQVRMETTFPIPESARGDKTFSHPYFTMTTCDTGNEAPVKFEWQIHPARDGMLRYTLVREDEKLGSSICAIYHDAGWEPSLSIGYSEGVLLLSEAEKDVEFEGIIVASLLGILVQLRMFSPFRTRTRKPGQVERIWRHSMAMLMSK